MYPLRPGIDFSPGFILAAILGHDFSEYAESLSARSGMPKINRAELADYSMAFPSTKTEQDSSASIFSDMDTKIDMLEAKLDKARQIKQGMMQQLLTGRIRLV
jgi:restriction endonuclease S subunit